MRIAFTVPSVPVAQPRQRQSARIITVNGKQVATSKNYTPTKAPVNAFKAAVQMALQAAHRGPPLQGSLLMKAVFYMPRPKGMFWKSKPMPAVSHTTKPDLDNLLKSVKDALSGLAYCDDAQVSRIIGEKWITAGDESPRVEIVIKHWEPAVVAGLDSKGLF